MGAAVRSSGKAAPIYRAHGILNQLHVCFRLGLDVSIMQATFGGRNQRMHQCQTANQSGNPALELVQPGIFQTQSHLKDCDSK